MMVWPLMRLYLLHLYFLHITGVSGWKLGCETHSINDVITYCILGDEYIVPSGHILPIGTICVTHANGGAGGKSGTICSDTGDWVDDGSQHDKSSHVRHKRSTIQDLWSGAGLEYKQIICNYWNCSVKCSLPSSFDGRQVSCTSSDLRQPVWGDECTFSCDNGYILLGPNKQQCTKDGKWAGGDDPSCHKMCPESRTGPYNASDPRDCSHFFLCTEDDAVYKTCPPGHGFNTITQDCQPDTKAQCLLPSTPITTTAAPSTTSSVSKTSTTITPPLTTIRSNCGTPSVPKNGAIVCDGVMGVICQVFCDSRWDVPNMISDQASSILLPSGGNHLLFCNLLQSQWDNPPNCSEPRIPGHDRLPSPDYYFSDCNDSSTHAKFKEKLYDSLGSSFYGTTFWELQKSDGGENRFGVYVKCDEKLDSGSKSAQPQLKRRKRNSEQCKNLENDISQELSCTDNGFQKTCSLSCKEGTYLLPGGSPVVTCGYYTGYRWTPQEQLPKCAVPFPPTIAYIENQVYATDILCNEEDKTVLNTLIRNLNVSRGICAASADCYFEVKCHDIYGYIIISMNASSEFVGKTFDQLDPALSVISDTIKKKDYIEILYRIAEYGDNFKADIEKLLQGNVSAAKLHQAGQLICPEGMKEYHLACFAETITRPEDSGLATTTIIIVIISSILFVVLVTFSIVIFCIRKKKSSSAGSLSYDEIKSQNMNSAENVRNWLRNHSGSQATEESITYDDTGLPPRQNQQDQIPSPRNIPQISGDGRFIPHQEEQTTSGGSMPDYPAPVPVIPSTNPFPEDNQNQRSGTSTEQQINGHVSSSVVPYTPLIRTQPIQANVQETGDLIPQPRSSSSPYEIPLISVPVPTEARDDGTRNNASEEFPLPNAGTTMLDAETSFISAPSDYETPSPGNPSTDQPRPSNTEAGSVIPDRESTYTEPEETSGGSYRPFEEIERLTETQGAEW